MARWATDQQCPCGRHTAILESLEGRIEDMCITPTAAKCSGSTPSSRVSDIKLTQVVQEKVDRFVIYVVPGEGFNAHDIETIQKNMRLHVGDVDTRVECVDHIEKTPSGNFRRCSASCRRTSGAGRRRLIRPRGGLPGGAS